MVTFANVEGSGAELPVKARVDLPQHTTRIVGIGHYVLCALAEHFVALNMNAAEAMMAGMVAQVAAAASAMMFGGFNVPLSPGKSPSKKDSKKAQAVATGDDAATGEGAAEEGVAVTLEFGNAKELGNAVSAVRLRNGTVLLAFKRKWWVASQSSVIF